MQEGIFMRNRKTPSSNDYSKHPDSSFDLINKYGTYEIQATAETDNMYPTIAQGYNPKIKSRDGENPIPPKYPKSK